MDNTKYIFENIFQFQTVQNLKSIMDIKYINFWNKNKGVGI
jgi:hypothetical protein